MSRHVTNRYMSCGTSRHEQVNDVAIEISFSAATCVCEVNICFQTSDRAVRLQSLLMNYLILKSITSVSSNIMHNSTTTSVTILTTSNYLPNLR